MEVVPIAGKSSILRSINRGIVLNVIRREQPISRSRIATVTGLNPSTVSEVTAELIKEQLLYEKSHNGHGVGRTPISLYLKYDGHFLGAIQIDESESRVAIADLGGNVRMSASVCSDTSDAPGFIYVCVRKLLELADALGVRNLETIGVAVSGIVDPGKATIVLAPALGWENVEVGRIARSVFPDVGEVVVGDVVKASAVAEVLFGDNKVDLSNSVYLRVGDNVGAAIFVDGRALLGEHFSSGELSHMVIHEGGAICDCGVRGCWEAYVSNHATSLRYVSHSEKTGGTESLPDVLEMISRARNGDNLAASVLKQTGHYLGIGIATIVKTIDPSSVIIDGAIVAGWGLIYPEIMRVLRRRLPPAGMRFAEVIPASRRTEPFPMGPLALAIHQRFNGYRITELSPFRESRQE